LTFGRLSWARSNCFAGFVFNFFKVGTLQNRIVACSKTRIHRR
jgi:hypothetical protein